MSISELKKCGHPTQLYAVEELKLVGGKANEMRLINMRNGKGLNATFAADRCLDLYRLEYKGINLGFFSPCGYVAPEYYDKNEFLRSFTAGFITTCGITNCGRPADDEYGLGYMHGRIGNTPAEYVSYKADYSGVQPAITAEGVMNEAVLFSEKLQLRRKIEMFTDKNEILIHDAVENGGGTKQPLMLLYHINFGYPLLDEGIEMFVPSLEVTPYNDDAKKGIDTWNEFPDVLPQEPEQCFDHKLAEKDGESSFAIFNHKLNIGVMITADRKTLDSFTEWKTFEFRDYALGFEPGSATVEGRKYLSDNGKLKFIAPDEIVDFNLKITILDGDEGLKIARDRMDYLLK